MSRALVLEAAAVDALASGGPARDSVRAALEAAHRLGRRVIVPSLVLAGAYRDRHRQQSVDALLARERGLALRDTDRPLARLVGALLAAADLGSEAIVDAHVIAASIEAGGGVCLTGDEDDLEPLAAGSASVVVVGLP